MVSDKKIAVLGLDNAGKTSIITAMKKRFDVPAAVKGLKPTKRISRSFPKQTSFFFRVW